MPDSANRSYVIFDNDICLIPFYGSKRMIDLAGIGA
jgi:hypothetical protein